MRAGFAALPEESRIALQSRQNLQTPQNRSGVIHAPLRRPGVSEPVSLAIDARMRPGAAPQQNICKC
jgi:hypothetical protein